MKSSKKWDFGDIIILLLLQSVVLVVPQYTVERPANKNYFKVAIFEHALLGNFSVDTPLEIINKNLHFYNLAATTAKQKGADMIVYPEYTLLPLLNRTEMKSYLETIPNPEEVAVNPCIEAEEFQDRFIIRNLSCLARNNEIVIVANIGDIQPCSSEEKGCPEDGTFHYNANIVFDKQGTIISRFWKEHLFFEYGMDLPTKPQRPIFETDFGTFSHFICFDVWFKHIVETGRDDKVTAVILSAMWLNMRPIYDSTQFWMSWALGTNTTFIVANAHIPGYVATGSGVFSGNMGPIMYTYNPDGFSKLLVSRVPKSKNQTFPFLNPDADITIITANGTRRYDEDSVDFDSYLPEVCSTKIVGEPVDIYEDYRCFYENMENYTFVELSKQEDHVEACNNGMCCSVNYSMDATNETFYLGVMNGTETSGHYYIDHYRWCTENCIVARCESYNGSVCGIFPSYSTTKFQRLHLTANFTTSSIFPSVVRTGMRLTPLEEWNFSLDPQDGENYEASISFTSTPNSKPLVIAAFTSRCFDRDPPFIR